MKKDKEVKDKDKIGSLGFFLRIYEIYLVRVFIYLFLQSKRKLRASS